MMTMLRANKNYYDVYIHFFPWTTSRIIIAQLFYYLCTYTPVLFFHQFCIVYPSRKMFHSFSSRVHCSLRSSKPLRLNSSHHIITASTKLSKNRGKMCSPTASDEHHLPSRWYTVLALPFPDQRLGRRDISTFGRGVYTSRAGFFSNPLWVEEIDAPMCHLNSNYLQAM